MAQELLELVGLLNLDIDSRRVDGGLNEHSLGRGPLNADGLEEGRWRRPRV